MSLWLGVMACNRAVPPLPLPGTLRAHLENERFGTVTSIHGLPLGVRDGLRELVGSRSPDIVDPDAGFEASDPAGSPERVSRRLIAAGCSADHCLVYFERGGVAHAWRVALFHWTPEATRFDWGGAAPGGLATIDDVRTAVLSGKVTSPDRSW